MDYFLRFPALYDVQILHATSMKAELDRSESAATREESSGRRLSLIEKIALSPVLLVVAAADRACHLVR